jgi:ABC-type glycerol-3-phosphate transport system substrate-binding protein
MDNRCEPTPRAPKNGDRLTGGQITRRGFLLGSLGVAGVALLPGCGGSESERTTGGATGGVARQMAETGEVGQLPDGLVEIDYWHRQTGESANQLQRLAEKFNKEYEGQIRVTPVAQGDIQELRQKVQSAAQGGGLPGALMADDYDVTLYAFSGITVPLESYMQHSEYGLTQQELDAFLPDQINRHELQIYSGHTMAFPQAFSAFATFWNAKALQRAGFDGPPKTWQEFPDHLRAVSDANKGMSGWYISGAGDRFISTMLTYSVPWIKDNYQESNFDAPEALEIMTWWKQLYDEGLLDFPSGDVQNLFASSRCAYFMDSSANAPNFRGLIEDFPWDARMPPQGEDNKEFETETYGPVNVVPKSDRESQLAGWLWLKWLTNPDPQADWVEVSGYFPSTRSAVQGTGLQSYYEQNPTAGKLFEEVAPQAHILPPHPALAEVRGRIVADAVDAVMTDRLSTEEGIERMKAESDEAISSASRSY